jgi:hypothetical protein
MSIVDLGRNVPDLGNPLRDPANRAVVTQTYSYVFLIGRDQERRALYKVEARPTLALLSDPDRDRAASDANRDLVDKQRHGHGGVGREVELSKRRKRCRVSMNE